MKKVLEKGNLRQYSDFGHCSVGGDIYGFSSIVNLSSGAYLVSYLGIFAANWHLRRETGSSKILILAGFGLMLFILTAFIVSIAVG